MRSARQEAFDRLHGRYEVRVLEPSPPAIKTGPWFADDPAARGTPPTGRELVSPVSKGDLQWNDLLLEHEGLAEWCSDRWLGAYRTLLPAPPKLVETRNELHRLAEHVISPARAAVNSKIGLRWTHDGFGTPYFGEDVQVRVEGEQLILDSSAGLVREPIESLANAAALVGVALGEDAETSVDPRNQPLAVDHAAAACIYDWFGFVTNVLEQLRAEAGPELESSRVQIWPEHFDASVEFGSEAAGERAGFGGSPGDAEHPEPYLYVVPWDPSLADGEAWNSEAFNGAELGYSQLLETETQRELALEFFRSRLRLLVD
jgi:hypothetical protein